MLERYIGMHGLRLCIEYEGLIMYRRLLGAAMEKAAALKDLNIVSVNLD